MAEPPLSRVEVIEIAERALRRSSAGVRLEMKRGLSGRATIASTAPLIGILDVFKGCIGQKWFCAMMVIDGVCEALVTTALGLLVAVPAVWFYNYLSNMQELFDIEMKIASLELVNYLVLHLGRRK